MVTAAVVVDYYSGHRPPPTYRYGVVTAAVVVVVDYYSGLSREPHAAALCVARHVGGMGGIKTTTATPHLGG